MGETTTRLAAQVMPVVRVSYLLNVHRVDLGASCDRQKSAMS
jgi:hypothetical protein